MKKTLSFVLFFSVILNVSAWDAVGHRIVADVAYSNLTKKARLQCDKILGEKGIIYQSSWADEIKSDSTYAYSYVWHYQNLPPNISDAEVLTYLSDTEKDGRHIFWAISAMKTRLLENKADAEALKFLVHFAGDMFQPLHLGRLDDLGGNRVTLRWFGQQTNIHSVWDGKIVDFRRMSSSEYSDFLRSKFADKRNEFYGIPLEQSLLKIHDFTEQIYAYKVGETTDAYLYLYRFSPAADEMLFRAGLFLARTLNEIYR